MSCTSSLQQLGIAPEDLEYRWEGNFTLVASHKKTRRVLRIKKIEARAPPNNKDVTFNSENKDCLPGSLNVTNFFSELVMRPLLGDSFLLPLDLAHVDSQTLRLIDSSMHPHRPEFRRAKQVDTQHNEVVVTRDAAYLPWTIDRWALAGSKTLCVEIKPKQGFICSADLGLEGSCNKSVCRFCLRQIIPANRHQQKRQSRYCPCDLFSGDKQRMLDALTALVETPQNNFRVLQDAKCVYESDSPIDSLTSCLIEFFEWTEPLHQSVDNKLMGNFLQTLYQILMCEFAEATDFVYPKNSTYSQFCSRTQRVSASGNPRCGTLEQTQLNPNCVLGRILSVQLLDQLGIEGTLPHYQNVAAFLHDTGAIWDYSKGSLKDFAESLNAPLSVTQSAQHYEAYLTSLVAKDCSIMVTMAPSCLPAADLPASVSHVSDPSSGRGILFSLAIVDLDPKPFDRIKMHHEEFLRLKSIGNATTTMPKF